MNDIDNMISDYLTKTLTLKSDMQSKLFTIFSETTGYSPEDLCLVERRLDGPTELKTIYYFDVKKNHFEEQK